LCIRDNGSGIPLDAREHIFEPYFTTKAADKGTGLGLSMARAIIEEAGGRIEFDSEIGKGTEFRIYFPASIAASAPGVAAEASVGKPVRDSRSGTLLVVDDEAPVRSIAAQMLKYLGYKVIEAADGIEAIAKITTSDVPIDAVLLDVYMPKLSGRETYKTLRERGINVPVIVCSGFTVEADEFTALSSNRQGGPVQVIQKPYSMECLARVVSRAVSTVSESEEVLAA
jgi:CheY-like chemotaxis protein